MGPAAQLKAVAQRLYNGTGDLPLWPSRCLWRLPPTLFPFPTLSIKLLQTSTQGPKERRDLRAGAFRSKVNFHPVTAWETGTKPPDLILFSIRVWIYNIKWPWIQGLSQSPVCWGYGHVSPRCVSVRGGEGGEVSPALSMRR